MRTTRLLLITLGVFIIFEKYANAGEDNLMAVGQGISLPATTSTVNYSDGFTATNPNGVLYQDGGRFSLEYDQNDSGSSNNLGAELGYGTHKWGLAIGYQKNNCQNCDGRWAADLGIGLGDTGVGVRVQDKIYELGFLIGITGKHRWGINLGLDETGGAGQKINAYGLGYSFKESAYSFTFDVSRRFYEDKTQNSEVTIVTPGLTLSGGPLQVSLNDRITIDNKNKTQDQKFWFGIGVDGKFWHIVGYSDYVNDIVVVVSFFF